MACVSVNDNSSAVAGTSRQIARIRMPSLLMLITVLQDADKSFSNIIWLHFAVFIEKSRKKGENSLRWAGNCA